MIADAAVFETAAANNLEATALPEFGFDGLPGAVFPASAGSDFYSGTRVLPVPSPVTTSLPNPEYGAELREHNVCGGDFLGSPPLAGYPALLPGFETRVVNTPENELGQSRAVNSGTLATGGDTYVPLASSSAEVAAAIAFTAAQKAAETRAEKPRAQLHGAVFSLMQYAKHPGTREQMWTQEQIDRGVQGLLDAGLTIKGADIWHGLDRELIEVGGVEVSEGPLKPLHWHGVVWVVGGDLTARQIADRFQIPLNKVKLPRELAQQEGRTPHRGRGSAERAFFDYCEYLVHENSRAREQLKYHYPYAAVRAWCS